MPSFDMQNRHGLCEVLVLGLAVVCVHADLQLSPVQAASAPTPLPVLGTRGSLPSQQHADPGSRPSQQHRLSALRPLLVLLQHLSSQTLVM